VFNISNSQQQQGNIVARGQPVTLPDRQQPTINNNAVGGHPLLAAVRAQGNTLIGHVTTKESIFCGKGSGLVKGSNKPASPNVTPCGINQPVVQPGSPNQPANPTVQPGTPNTRIVGPGGQNPSPSVNSGGINQPVGPSVQPGG